MKLFLVRHGQTVANRDQFYSGQSDIPLTEQGRQEAEAIRPILAPFTFDRVYCSDLSRAMNTQRLALPDAVAETTPLLREFDVGSLTGKGFAEVRAMQDNTFRSRLDFTGFGGENIDMVCDRVRAFLSQLEADPCENVIAFAHNGVLGCALRTVLNADIDSTAAFSRNCAIHVFEYDGTKWRLLAWNYMGKL